MFTRDFNYPLPAELIAQHPSPERDASRLLALNRSTGSWDHHRFPALLQYLQKGDVLVLNDSRVIPARLRGRKRDSGGGFEILLLEELGPMDWWVLLRPGKRVPVGCRLEFQTLEGHPSALTAEVREKNAEGWCRLQFHGVPDLRTAIEELGELPLPPYIHRQPGTRDPVDWDRYQTVYAQNDGSVAAPTAGLHFTQELLREVERAGVEIRRITLHVGHGTFAPVKADRVDEHVMHEERYEVSETTAAALNAARAQGRRIIAVGTTSVRVLESVGRAHGGRMVPGAGRTRIFIRPPDRFTLVDAMITNFHLPESTLLMLVSAFASPGEETRGRDLILAAYADAIRERYRFFSYGDAMFLH